MSRPLSYLIVALLLLTKIVSTQQASFNIYPDSLKENRLKTMIITSSVVYTASMIGLYNLWYKEYPQTSFHFINDNNEWQSMDKLGHIFTTYSIARLGYSTFRWTGLSKKKSIWFGGLLGLAHSSIVEVMDGHSAEWGASPGDFIANTIGTSLFISQQLLWNEQRIVLKYSYHPTIYPNYRPDLLGRTTIQNILEDYNGITIWMSVNIRSFLRKKSKFPKWLNIAFGYGADGMTGASVNSSEYNGKNIPSFRRSRQFYIALDIDLTNIPTRSKFMHILFNALSFIKIPLPTFEINSGGGFKFHPLYF